MTIWHPALRAVYVLLVFCAALSLGALKGLLVGPVAALVLILGNIGVLLALFPAHVCWAIYTILRTGLCNTVLKVVLVCILPLLFAFWLVLSIVGSVLVGFGYGFFAPWVSTFEAFRQSNEQEKFLHCIMDGTWSTVKGSCTVVRDFADICYHSYPVYLKELRNICCQNQPHTIRFVEVPSCILVGLIGIVLEIPFYTVIALVKSPYLLFKGWKRLLQDLISGEGLFLETACVPIAGLAIVLWPLVVVGGVLLALFSSIFVGLYGAVIAYQEKSFRRGVAYLISMVSEFDEYTNDLLYLREGSILPKPHYRKKKTIHSQDVSVEASVAKGRGSSDPPAMLVPSLAPSRSVREAIQEVKMVQVWESMMRSCETDGKEMLDAAIITANDLNDWLRAKGTTGGIIGVGLPSYTMLRILLDSINAGVEGLLLNPGVELNQLNRPQDRLMDWFFHPILVLKEQIKIIKMADSEVRFLEKLTLYGGNVPYMENWKNDFVIPGDPLRAAQIQALSRRLVGISVSISKFPTYRRRYRQIMKNLIAYSYEKDGYAGTRPSRFFPSVEVTQDKV